MSTLFIVDAPLPCADHPYLFDPHEPGTRKKLTEINHRGALQICNTCPVIDACRQWALTEGPRDGSIIAGMTGQQRKEIIEIMEAVGDDQPQPTAILSPREVGGECRRGHGLEQRYRSRSGYLRCHTCEREHRRNSRQRQAASLPPADTWTCARNHPPDRYRKRPSTGQRYCRECQNIAASERRSRTTLNLQPDDGRCRNNHRPERKYTRPNGARRCADCDAEYEQRRKERRRKAVAA